MQKISLSYVLPTYNRAEYLGECLLSLEEQDYDQEEYEIIVVDDGSIDSTKELVECMQKANKNIRLFSLSHKGVEEARNYGNQQAEGEIIGVCDSDDLYHDQRTKITINYFKKHPEIDIINGSYWEIDHRGILIQYYEAEKLNQKLFMAGKSSFFCHDNCAYRKNKALKTPYRAEGGQTDDWKFVHDWIEAGYKFGFIKKELCKVRTLKNGIMGARREKIGLVLPYAK
jgi:glycosyltransferase involved in cell wall biosynthesis